MSVSVSGVRTVSDSATVSRELSAELVKVNSLILVTSCRSRAAVPGDLSVGATMVLDEATMMYSGRIRSASDPGRILRGLGDVTDALRAALSQSGAEFRLRRAAELSRSGRRIESEGLPDALEFLASGSAAMIQSRHLDVGGGSYL